MILGKEMVQKMFEEPQRKKIITLLGIVGYIAMLLLPSFEMKGEGMTGWKFFLLVIKEDAPWYLYLMYIVPIMGLILSERKEQASIKTGICMLVLPIVPIIFPLISATTGMFIYIACSIIMIAIATESFKKYILDSFK